MAPITCSAKFRAEAEAKRASYEAERKQRTAEYFSAAGPEIEQRALTGASERHTGAFSDGQKEG